MYKWTDREMWFIKHNDHLKSDLISNLLHKDVEEVEYYREKLGLRCGILTEHYLYNVWYNMKNRCYNKNDLGYKNYGGRDIKVCDRWLNSFDNFLEDMSDRPSQDYQIDRIDNDGDYTPENCRWVTQKENQRNKRTNRLITAFGETKSLIEWLEDKRCMVKTRNGLMSRIKIGIDPEIAIKTPAPQKRGFWKNI